MDETEPTSPRPAAAFEPPELDRPASSAPTERQLETETPGGIAAAAHDPYAALRFRDCRLFLIGWVITVVGTQMQFTAVGWDLYQRTGKAMSLGWAGLVQALPVMILAIPAGQIADLLSRRAIVIAGQSGLVICSLALAAISHYQGSVGWMYGVLGIGAVCTATAGPARSALLATTVPTEHYSNAVTWNSNFFQTAAMIGPAIAGLILIRSTSAVYLLDASSSVICVALLAQLSSGIAASSSGSATLKTLMAGVKFVWGTPIILATITLDLFAVLLGGATYLLPIYATNILHVGAVGFGWMRAAPAIGAVAMGVTIAHLPPMKKAGRNLLLAVSGFGIATIIFGLSRSFWLSILMLFLTGALDNVSVVVRHTLVQVLTPDAMRGRVSAVNNVFIGASNELGGWESGMTAAWFGPFWSVVGGGIGTLLVVAATAIVWPQVRRFGSLAEAKPADQPEERGFEVIAKSASDPAWTNLP